MAAYRSTHRACDLKRVHHLYVPHEPYGPDVCVYCGDPASSRDHVTPVCYVAAISDHTSYYGRQDPGLLIVPACRDCNQLLGSYLAFSVDEKREALKRRLRAKWQRLLGDYDWQPQELRELGHTLRRRISAMERKRLAVVRRLAFPTQAENMLLRVSAAIAPLSRRQDAPRGGYAGPYSADLPAEAPHGPPAPDWPALAVSWPYRQLAFLPAWGLEPVPPTRRSRWC